MSEHEGTITGEAATLPAPVQYELDSDLQRMRFTLGRTSIIVEGPADEAANGQVLMASLPQLIQAALDDIEIEGVTGDEEYEYPDNEYEYNGHEAEHERG